MMFTNQFSKILIYLATLKTACLLYLVLMITIKWKLWLLRECLFRKIYSVIVLMEIVILLLQSFQFCRLVKDSRVHIVLLLYLKLSATHHVLWIDSYITVLLFILLNLCRTILKQYIARICYFLHLLKTIRNWFWQTRL